MTGDETWITLTASEIINAGVAGVMRQTHVIREDLQGRYNEPKHNCWQRHVEGALTECAMAKYLNLYWQGKGEPGGRDLGINEVRSAQPHSHRLMLHPEDKDDSKYWFLTGAYGTYKLRGWIMGIDGKQPEYWEDPVKEKGGESRPAYFVPHSKLNKPE